MNHNIGDIVWLQKVLRAIHPAAVPVEGLLPIGCSPSDISGEHSDPLWVQLLTQAVGNGS